MKSLNLITAILLMHVISYSQVIHIPSDYPTIQSGINASNNGDIVLVDTGVMRKWDRKRTKKGTGFVQPLKAHLHLLLFLL